VNADLIEKATQLPSSLTVILIIGQVNSLYIVSLG